MSESSFPTAHKHVLAYEGGYSNHPADPGGVTLNGIIQRVYDAWRVAHGKTKRALTRAMLGTAEWIAERDAIYRSNYWLPIRCPELEPGVDAALYDYGVNSGVGRAAKVLQRLVGVSVDGRIGPVTVAAANAKDPEALVAAICTEREAFLRRLKTFPTFGKGWLRRVSGVLAYATVLAANYKARGEVPVPAPELVSEPMARGEVPEPKTAKNIVKGTPVAMGAEEAAREQVTPPDAGFGWADWIGAHPAEAVLIGAAVIVAVVVALHLVGVWHRRQQEAPVPGFDYGAVPNKA